MGSRHSGGALAIPRFSNDGVASYLHSRLPALTDFTSPRAWAFGLIGIHEYLRRLSGDSLVNQTRETLTSRLMELFDRSASAGLVLV